MKPILSITLILLSASLNSQTSMKYYFPESEAFNPSISTPFEATGYHPGDWHFSHDQLLGYVYRIAEESERIQIFEYARTWENRPLVYLVITSKNNHNRLEDIRKSHLLSLNGKGNHGPANTLIVHLGYGVHGNESSASNASMLTLYYLAASENSFVKELLEESVIILDPCLNPDGFQRHSTWVNMNESQTPVTDPAARQFNEPWPGARTNHYWFDLNRDYIPLVNPESLGRIELYHHWKPHVLTDHHEMGANSTFFFQPGVPSRNNPITPEENYSLTERISRYHAKALDSLAVPYFTRERFDDYYYGKGSSYPDVNGGIGILFEQAGYRGHTRETIHGTKTFAYAVRNQLNVSISTLKASLDMKKDLLDYQVRFFTEAIEKASQSEITGYVFGEKYDMTRLRHFTELLKAHQIKVLELKNEISISGEIYKPGEAFIVPVKQPQFRLIRSFFEPVGKFTDTTFYDVSTWHLPKAFNISYSGIKSQKLFDENSGDELKHFQMKSGIRGKGTLALLMKWDEFFSPAVLYAFMSKEIRTYVSKDRYTLEGNEFSYGTLVIPLKDQKLPSDEILELAENLADRYHVEFYRSSTFMTDSGITLGSDEIKLLEKPSVALISGPGTSSYTVGEIWHLLDVRYNIPVTLIDSDQITAEKLDRYNVLILSGWNYNFGNIEDLKNWVIAGGILVSSGWTLAWLERNEFLDVEFKPAAQVDPDRYISYADRDAINSIHRIAGSIFQIEADLSHPLFYGYHNPLIPVFRNTNSVIMPKNQRFAHPGIYTEHPLLSGYSSHENTERISKSPFCLIESLGKGRIIHIMDNTQFRGKWDGTSKIFANAILFGGII